jgi:hypothetical protein
MSSMSRSYVVIKYKCQYTAYDWAIVGIYQNLDEAKLVTCKHLVSVINSPRVLENYRTPVKLPMLPDLFIEIWDISQKIATYRLGWDIKCNTHIHYIHQELCKDPSKIDAWNDNLDLLYDYFICSSG